MWRRADDIQNHYVRILNSLRGWQGPKLWVVMTVAWTCKESSCKTCNSVGGCCEVKPSPARLSRRTRDPSEPLQAASLQPQTPPGSQQQKQYSSRCAAPPDGQARQQAALKAA